MKKYSNVYAVIGLGFGDEGKGVSVNSLCAQFPNSLVVRYSGGQQAGHTVVSKGISHVFSNFGSGTIAGAPTYWSKYCTFDPVGVVNEFMVLKKKGITPYLFIDRRCPITTPYDKIHNRMSTKTLNNGSCGVGVGATYKREEHQQSLLVEDFMYPSIFQTKLKLVKNYYKIDANINYFLECCEFVKKNIDFVIVDDMPKSYNDVIFEGSQGLLLDQNIGFFPHVTPSNVGTKNILEMGFDPHLILVTRAFQTRHGNGPMTNADIPHNIKNNPEETNVLNEYQGEFKKSLLDLDLLTYGMNRDEGIGNSNTKDLVITCLDLVKDEYRYTFGGKIVNHLDEDEFVSGIADELGFLGCVHRISSPDGTFRVEEENGTNNIQENVAI